MKTLIEEQSCLLPPNDGRLPHTIRTLLVEDDPLLMTLLGRILARDKRTFIVGSATDGWKALTYASSLQPDLLITDLHMPGLDGAEVTRLLKQLPNPPVIFVVTSDNTREERARSLAAGADAFLVKTDNLVRKLPSTIHDFFDDDLEEMNGQPAHRYEPITPANRASRGR